MTVVIDVAHPAHALRYIPVARALDEKGVPVLLVGRDKDVTMRIIADSGVDYVQASAAPGSTSKRPRALQLGAELTLRVARLCRIMQKSGCTIVLTSNPSGAIAGFLMRRPVVFDTVDGTAAGVHHHLAASAASLITSPTSLTEEYGQRHVSYRSLKALAWLHEDRFQPRSVPVLEGWGAKSGRAVVLVRAVKHSASHDRSARGLSSPLLRDVAKICRSAGALVICSAEVGHPEVRSSPALEDDPGGFSSVLAAADLVVTDSASVAEEAAVLGVKALRISSASGRRDYLEELEDRYSLVKNFDVTETAAFLDEVRRHLERVEQHRADSRVARRQLLADHHDGVSWYVDLVSAVLAAKNLRSTELSGLKLRFDERIASGA
jgi:predicted glycosyltransferase